MTAKKILTVGSLNTDLITVTRRLPSAGETLAAESFATAPGGKGANQAVAAARLSSPGVTASAMVGAVGRDAFGAELKRALAQDGVDVSGVEEVEGVSTGTAVIIVDKASADNRILFTAGANAHPAPAHFSPSFFSGTSASPAPSLLLLQLETPLQTVLHLISLAASASPPVPVLFNPAPAASIPLPYYEKLAYLIVNETEAAFLAGETSGAVALESKEGVEGVAARFVGRGVRRVVITLGGRGAYWACAPEGVKAPTILDQMSLALDANGNQQDEKRERVVTESGWEPVAAGKEDVVDTTGAGDTFVGAFAVAVIEGRSVKEAVAFASCASGRAVRKAGAMAAIPWRKEMGE